MNFYKTPYKLFVRLPGTNKFLKATGRWTKQVETALSFANPLQAIHTCIVRGFREVELVFHYADGKGEHSMRIDCA
jgi:hypothetical protein